MASQFGQELRLVRRDREVPFLTEVMEYRYRPEPFTETGFLRGLGSAWRIGDRAPPRKTGAGHDLVEGT